MKIAVPTDDGENISCRTGRSRGYAVATIEDDRIISTEVRWNLLSETLTSELGAFYNLHDCAKVLVNDETTCHCRRLKERKMELIETEENEIAKALMDYCEHLR